MQNSSALEQAQKISDDYGGVQVDLLYNGTNGLMMDLLCCLGAKFGLTSAYNQMCANFYINKLNEDPDYRFTSKEHDLLGETYMKQIKQDGEQWIQDHLYE